MKTSPRRTFQLDALYVLQFLGPDDKQTGHSLYTNVIQPLATQTDIHCQFFAINTREQLLEALTDIIRACESIGRLPILHLETHGSLDGISSIPSELVTWEELKPLLTRINELTRASLLVTLAACHGPLLGKTLITTDRAPLWALIGPDHQVLPSDLARCFGAFYGRFLTTLDLNDALEVLRAADNSNPYTWKIQSAEVFLAYVFGEFLTQASCPELLRRREDEAIAGLLRRGPASLARVKEIRSKLRPMLRNFEADFERMKTRFLMLDRFPENRLRFPLTYEEAVGLHAEVRQLIVTETALAHAV